MIPDIDVELRLRLHMISDWHIGTGTGAHGHVNRLVQRSADVQKRPGVPARFAGLPVVPGKSLVGVWRDACELAAHALDAGPTGVWHAWVDFLFGSQPAFPGGETVPRSRARPPRPAALAIDGALTMPQRLSEVLAARPYLHQAATFLKPGVAIDRKSGAAADDMLRFEEMARGGVELAGSARVRGLGAVDADQRSAALGLLWAGSELLESIGGNRRRGSGRCRLTMEGAGLPPDLGVIASWAASGPPSPPSPSVRSEPSEAALSPAPPGLTTRAEREAPTDLGGDHVDGSPAEAAPAGLPREEPTDPGGDHVDGSLAEAAPACSRQWVSAELVLTLVTPVLAHGKTVGNLVSGLDHLPGWTLLPEVLRRLGPEAAELARRGDLIVTAATPEVAGVPGAPVPRVFSHRKGEEVVISANRMIERGATPGTPCRSGYIDPRSIPPGGVHRPGFTVRMHNTIRDDVQRPTSEVGGVYVYSALDAGTVLRSTVRVRAGSLPSNWAERLPGRWHVGRSAKDDYGSVTVDLAPEAISATTEKSERAGGSLSGETIVGQTTAPAGQTTAPADADTGISATQRDITVGLTLHEASTVAMADTGAEVVVGREGSDVGLAGDTGARWLRVWLLSDALVRDGRLRPSTDPADFAQTLERALVSAGVPGVRLESVLDQADGLIHTATGVSRTDSWHRGWGLPRPTLLGLAAGSCFTYRVTSGALDSEGLAEVAMAGVGERRGEGFGRVVFDHPLLASRVAVTSASGSATGAASGTGGDASGQPFLLGENEPGHREARVFERAAWRQEIYRACAQIAADPDRRRDVLPETVGVTQLNALRQFLPDIDSDPGVLRRRLERLAATDTRRRAWTKEARSALAALLTEPHRVWELVALPEQDLTATRDGPRALREELRGEALRSLIAACLHAHTRAEGQRNGNGHPDQPATPPPGNGGARRSGKPRPVDGGAGRSGKPRPVDGGAGRSGKPRPVDGGAGRSGKPRPVDGGAGRSGKPRPVDGGAGRFGKPRPVDGGAGEPAKPGQGSGDPDRPADPRSGDGGTAATGSTRGNRKRRRRRK